MPGSVGEGQVKGPRVAAGAFPERFPPVGDEADDGVGVDDRVVGAGVWAVGDEPGDGFGAGVGGGEVGDVFGVVDDDGAGDDSSPGSPVLAGDGGV